MIIAHHHVIHNVTDVCSLSSPVVSDFYLCLQVLGKIGVVIFFLISAWYLCDEKMTNIKKNYLRIFTLEKQLFFYSIALSSGTLLIHHFVKSFPSLSTSLAIKSVIPVWGEIWWYCTAYVAFLLFCPFVTRSLVMIGQRLHFYLVLLLTVTWGVIYGLTPLTYLGVLGDSFVFFIILYSFVAYIKWYGLVPNERQSWILAIFGCSVLIACIICGGILKKVTGIGLFEKIQVGFAGSGKLPVILAALGIFFIAINKKHLWHNKIVNSIAASTLAVYLIHEYPTIRMFLACQFDIGKLTVSSWAPLVSIGIVLGIFVVCTAIDYVRRFLFKFVLDRHPGKYANKIWSFTTQMVASSRVWMKLTKDIDEPSQELRA
ncbi:Acyltransferase [Bifidobacterium dolichotidis]|uniref:Acyltransferase n=2 Tax=Bifidobacterium dolichotidis TaxID=2306976 RepID=A0A430FRQ7_9BIFI|nr:Acyltransferase [Bifidobacterium dolichotidis]